METKLLIYHHSKFPPRHINGEGLGLAKTMIGVEKLPWICYFWPGRGKLDSPTQQHGLPKALPNGRIGISPHNYLWEYKWWPPLVLQCKGHIMDSKDGWMRFIIFLFTPSFTKRGPWQRWTLVTSADTEAFLCRQLPQKPGWRMKMCDGIRPILVTWIDPFFLHVFYRWIT